VECPGKTFAIGKWESPTIDPLQEFGCSTATAISGGTITLHYNIVKLSIGLLCVYDCTTDGCLTCLKGMVATELSVTESVTIEVAYTYTLVAVGPYVYSQRALEHRNPLECAGFGELCSVNV
jgi:hypothetical protein